MVAFLSGCSVYHVSQGDAYLKDGNLPAAEAEYRSAGDWTTAKLNLAVVLMKQGRLAEARALLEPMARTGPRNPPTVYLGSGGELSNSGDLARHNLSLVYSDLAAERIRAGNCREALRLAEQALKNNPDNLYAKANKGVCLARRAGGNLGLAILDFVARAPEAANLPVTGEAGEAISLKVFAERQIQRYAR